MLFLHHFGFGENRVRIGLNLIMAKHKAHGQALIPTGTRLRHVPFIVDSPQKLNRPDMDLVQDVVKQLSLLGHTHVDTLELKGDRYRSTYSVKDTYPTLVSRQPVLS